MIEEGEFIPGSNRVECFCQGREEKQGVECVRRCIFIHFSEPLYRVNLQVQVAENVLGIVEESRGKGNREGLFGRIPFIVTE